MQKTIELFRQIFTELLEDEDKNAVARHIPSAELYETIDLSLKKAPLSEADFEKVLKELVFSTTRTATSGFFNQLFGEFNPLVSYIFTLPLYFLIFWVISLKV